MSAAPPVLRTVPDLRTATAQWREAGERIGFVPTMGALHEGHLSLVRQARAASERCIVSLFVNPRQFGPREDFSAYPRDESGDLAKLAAAGVDLAYAPGVEAMYPDGAATSVDVGALGAMLEGESRPGFFTGVATVVTKLLLQTGADVALFGEKDYQQLQVIRRMVADLDIPTRIVGCETVRDADGLALSSRNAYLSAEERRIAPALHRALQEAAEAVRAGADPDAACARAAERLLASGFQAVDYLAIRDAETLAPVDREHEGAKRALGAAKLGGARLIDNIAV
ncbi:MAG: pantoate--beta-alanine ligase [Alphaproteobacteria bacterium]|nr:pantoate--beta-alanine ligase [Alphaproteobacteria bacterium]